MRILVICHRLPYPPKRGGKIRPFNIIKHLTNQGHEVTVGTLARSRNEEREGEKLSDYCQRVLVERIGRPAAMVRMVSRLPSSIPSSMGYFYSPRLRSRIREIVEKEGFDLIFAHCSSVAQYVENVQGIPKILDFGDMDSQKWLLYSKVRRFPLSAGFLVEGTKLQAAEKSLAAKFDICTCTTKAELETLQGYGTGTRADWFPNGVDADYFQPASDKYDANTLCFVGRMDYFPNQQAVRDFCLEVLPRIRKQKPTAKMLIVGANPDRSIRSLASRPGITVTGSVPDVRPYVQQSALTVAPLRVARGTQNKILESMAMGVPVVSSLEAAGGVDAVPGEHFLTASSPEEYKECVLRLLDNRAQRDQLADAGRQRILSKHSWQNSMQSLDRIIAECLEKSTESQRNADPQKVTHQRF